MGGEVPKRPSYTTINYPSCRVDKDGEPLTVKLNHATMSTFFPGTADDYEQYHAAVKEFVDILYEQSITIKSQPGTQLFNCFSMSLLFCESNSASVELSFLQLKS